jgi:chemotaxis protein methyltransferase CheR
MWRIDWRRSSLRAAWARSWTTTTVHETYFWREIDQLRAVVDVVVPHLARRGASSLKIWSVPCSTGEEPLTLAMLLSESGWFNRLSIQLCGSDASPDAIGHARAGKYGQRSFRNLPEAMREKYFEPNGGKWAIVPDLHQRVSYDVVNLVAEDEVRRHASAPIIVCRNVFIYFSEESIRRAMGVFERAMPVPGYLCVGASESLLRRTVAFELQDVGGAFMYVKDAPNGQPSARLSGVERAS